MHAIRNGAKPSRPGVSRAWSAVEVAARAALEAFLVRAWNDGWSHGRRFDRFSPRRGPRTRTSAERHDVGRRTLTASGRPAHGWSGEVTP